MIEEKKPAIRKKARETESGACEGVAPSGRDADAALATAVTDAEASLDRAGKDTVVSAHSPDDGTPAKSGSRKVLLSRLAQWDVRTVNTAKLTLSGQFTFLAHPRRAAE